MKNLVFIFMALSAPMWALGQIPEEFAPVGAKWYYKIHPRATSSLNGPVSCQPFVYECVKDTVVFGKNCRKIVERSRNTWGDLPPKFVYQEGSKVYVWQKPYEFEPDTVFDLLYDFDALPGDTLFIDVKSTCNLHCWIDYEGWMGPIMEGSKYFYVVKSIDTVAIGSLEIGVQMVWDTVTTDYVWPTLRAYYNIFPFRIYRWIGGSQALFVQTFWWADDAFCHLTDSLVYYYSPRTGWMHFSGTPADTLPNPVVSRSSASVTSPVRAYPNPALDKFHVEHPFGSRLALYDASGRCILRQTSPGESTEWDVSHWPRGLYVLRVYDEQGREYAQKISLE